MGLSRKYLPWLACAAIATVSVPAFASGSPSAAEPLANGSVITYDFGFMDGSQASQEDNVVNITPGGTVTFSYPSGSSVHNVDFSSGPPPTSCVQTQAPPGSPIFGSPPPLPPVTEGPGWAGTCTFNAAGTYTFFCQAHDYMTGTIVVSNGTPTPTPTPT